MTVSPDLHSASIYKPRNAAERDLMQRAATGKPLELGTGDPELDDPAHPNYWDPRRAVRAEFLAALLSGDRTPRGGRLRSVKLTGGHITGHLNLEGRRLLCPLVLEKCKFDEPINLDEAEAVSIRLPGCHVPGLTAAQLQTIGSLEFDSGFSSRGEINLFGSHIRGSLKLSGARLTNSGGKALNADSIRVDHNVYFMEGFSARGEISLTGARIDGEFDLTEAEIANPGGRALYAHRLIVSEGMGTDYGFRAFGEVNLNGAYIGGNLQLDGACIYKEAGIAINAHTITVGKNMYCRLGFTARGKIGMVGAHIRGQLFFNDANIANSKGDALDAQGLTVGKDMFCEDFTARGKVNLIGASIGGELSFTGATLINLQTDAHHVQNDALRARHLTVGLNLECSEGFSANGKVNLRNSNISGQLNFTKAKLQPIKGWAIDLEQASIGNLLLPDTRPEVKNGITPANAVESTRRFYGIDLTNAQTRTFTDHQEGWPDALRIRGFIYDRLDNPLDRKKEGVNARLHWLQLYPEGFTPQVYDQLADFYRRIGEDGKARKVLVAKQRQLGKWYTLSWLWYITVGYGYRTWQALAWVVVLVVAGSLAFQAAYPAHMTTAVQPKPKFESIVYTLEVMLPLGGQKSVWQPTGWYLDWYWFLAIAGWVLSAAVVAGLAGVLRRD